MLFDYVQSTLSCCTCHPSTFAEHIPKAPFYKVEAVIRSWRLQGVTEVCQLEWGTLIGADLFGY
jgi:hypothetical protein